MNGRRKNGSIKNKRNKHGWKGKGETSEVKQTVFEWSVRRYDMHAKVELTKAFSVRDEHEFFPIRHLMARLNPNLLVKQIATGVHVDGGGTVFWGLVYLNGKPPDKNKVEIALREAGFDFAHNVLTQTAFVWTDHSAEEK
jgi:hypothetical protein